MGKLPNTLQEGTMNINSSSLYGVSAYQNYNATSSNEMSTHFAEALLSSMDVDESGGVDSAEFSQAALELSGISDESTLSVAFSGLDSDANGALSLDELTSAFESMASSGMMAAGGQPPPPPGPPPSHSENEEDTGYTVDELTSLASEVSSTDSDLSSLFETLVANFDAADANGDGKITSAEAMAYQASSKEESMGVSDKKGEEAFMKGLMAQLISSYTTQNSTTQSMLNLSA